MSNLFSILPFHNDDSSASDNATNDATSSATPNSNNNSNDDGVQLRPNAVIPFIPGGVTYQLKRALNKAGCNTFITSGMKLQNVLCAKNKGKKDIMQKSGVYKYTCPRHNIHYVGETKRSFQIRDTEHRKAAQREDLDHSGLAKHMAQCNATIPKPEILHINDDRKKNPKYDLRIMEALQIRRHNCGPGRGMNEDLGWHVTTNQWQPLFNKMGQTGGGGQGSFPLHTGLH